MKLKLLALSLFMLFICFVYVIYQPLYRDWDIGVEFYHDLLGWHLPNEIEEHTHNYCKFCDKEIIQDSQEHWYFGLKRGETND